MHQPIVQMVQLDYMEDLQSMMEYFKYVIMKCGVLYVTIITGIMLILMLFVMSWDTQFIVIKSDYHLTIYVQ